MEEIQRYADLLALLEVPADGDNAPQLLPEAAAAHDDDPEVEEWASLLFKASPALMQKTRLRICVAGLSAVHRHITKHPYSN